MATDPSDRLFRSLRDDPERRDEIRRLILTDELLRLPDLVAVLADAQRRTQEQLETLAGAVQSLAGHVQSLAEAQRGTEERLGSLIEQVSSLIEQVSSIVEQVSSIVEQVGSLVAQVSEMAGHVEWLKGDAMERRYRERAAGYFGHIARKIHTLTQDETEELLEGAESGGALTETETQEIRSADAIVRGRRDEGEVYLVVEASWGVGLDDVRRARDRAELLAKTGLTTIAVVAGTWITPDARRAAPQVDVWQVENGHVTPPGGAGSWLRPL